MPVYVVRFTATNKRDHVRDSLKLTVTAPDRATAIAHARAFVLTNRYGVRFGGFMNPDITFLDCVVGVGRVSRIIDTTFTSF